MPIPLSPFASSKSIYAGLTVVVLKPSTGRLSAVTAATSTLTLASHGLADGDAVTFVSGTGFTGLTAGTPYYVVASTSSTFGLAATPGGAAIAVGTSSAGVFDKTVIFESRMIDSELEQDEKHIELPDASGVLRRVRSVLTKQQESFKFEVMEAKRLLAIFGGAMAGRITGKTTLYIPDPDDVSGKVALKSETDFDATITRDGGVKFGDADFTKATIKLTSNKKGAITWTADATV